MIIDTLKSIISGRLVTEYVADEIDYDTTLDDLSFNEFDIAELCMGIETEFDIELSDEQVAGFKTIGDVAGAIEESL